MDKIYIGTKMPDEIKRELEYYGIIYPEAEKRQANGKLMMPQLLVPNAILQI